MKLGAEWQTKGKVRKVGVLEGQERAGAGRDTSAGPARNYRDTPFYIRCISVLHPLYLPLFALPTRWWGGAAKYPQRVGKTDELRFTNYDLRATTPTQSLGKGTFVRATAPRLGGALSCAQVVLFWRSPLSE